MILFFCRSLDGDQQNVDLKRQLQVIEQEATVLRAKTQSLEADNEKLQAENKRLLVSNSTMNSLFFNCCSKTKLIVILLL